MKKSESSRNRPLLSSVLLIMLVVSCAFLAVNNARVGEIFYPGQYTDAEQEISSAVCLGKQRYRYHDRYGYAIALCDLEAYILYMEQLYSIYPPEWACPVFVVLPDVFSRVLD